MNVIIVEIFYWYTQNHIGSRYIWWWLNFYKRSKYKGSYHVWLVSRVTKFSPLESYTSSVQIGFQQEAVWIETACGLEFSIDLNSMTRRERQSSAACYPVDGKLSIQKECDTSPSRAIHELWLYKPSTTQSQVHWGLSMRARSANHKLWSGRRGHSGPVHGLSRERRIGPAMYPLVAFIIQ